MEIQKNFSINGVLNWKHIHKIPSVQLTLVWQTTYNAIQAVRQYLLKGETSNVLFEQYTYNIMYTLFS